MSSTALKASQEPFLHFSRARWAAYRQDTRLTLTPQDIEALRGYNSPMSLSEVEDIYLPLSRLLNLYVAANQQLHSVSSRFLGETSPKVPYIIGVAGSVAVGKSTTSRVLQALLSRWPGHPRVAVITTDGFLFPNAVLQKRHLMPKKGFPQSYNRAALLNFLRDLKAGKANLRVPVYSHHTYDIVADETLLVDQPDIVIVEGVNVLQAPNSKSHGARLFVSDYFDFSIFVDAPTEVIAQWFLQRFHLFVDQARHNPEAFFYQFAQMPRAQADAFARNVWQNTNERNLVHNILPYRDRARLILEKGKDHAIERVLLRRI